MLLPHQIVDGCGERLVAIDGLIETNDSEKLLGGGSTFEVLDASLLDKLNNGSQKTHVIDVIDSITSFDH
jgi:hypothetical protein